eukprot:TRINITY_DN22274_c0_g1_i1.p1 TRINITY_DN22274_c0_g1~~TRINITY_DN22274_c0_g1_i1.p1  ORF type:complete len:138 (+),score=21.45 TRINITY_DN22274_c0_g1_i1:129-542(+)
MTFSELKMKIQPKYQGESKRTKNSDKLGMFLNTDGVLCLGDVVLNHTVNNSAWLFEHPEAAYNIHNCPYLLPAFELDVVLQRLSIEILEGKYISCYDHTVRETDVPKIETVLNDITFPSLKMWEYSVDLGFQSTEIF